MNRMTGGLESVENNADKSAERDVQLASTTGRALEGLTQKEQIEAQERNVLDLWGKAKDRIAESTKLLQQKLDSGDVQPKDAELFKLLNVARARLDPGPSFRGPVEGWENPRDKENAVGFAMGAGGAMVSALLVAFSYMTTGQLSTPNAILSGVLATPAAGAAIWYGATKFSELKDLWDLEDKLRVKLETS